jgi:hypothetical protein
MLTTWVPRVPETIAKLDVTVKLHPSTGQIAVVCRCSFHT